ERKQVGKGVGRATPATDRSQGRPIAPFVIPWYLRDLVRSRRFKSWMPVMRLAGKISVIVGAGQSPGEGIGNGRATALRFAQEGAKILAVDRDLVAAEETAALAAKSGGECVAFQADVTREATLAAAMAYAVECWGRIDVLHNNVGVSIAGGDKPL